MCSRGASATPPRGGRPAGGCRRRQTQTPSCGEEGGERGAGGKGEGALVWRAEMWRWRCGKGAGRKERDGGRGSVHVRATARAAGAERTQRWGRGVRAATRVWGRLWDAALVCAARRRGAATRLGAGGPRPGAPQVQEVAPDRGRVAPEITWRGPLPTARLSSRHCAAGRSKWHPMTKTPLQHWLGGHK